MVNDGLSSTNRDTTTASGNLATYTSGTIGDLAVTTQSVTTLSATTANVTTTNSTTVSGTTIYGTNIITSSDIAYSAGSPYNEGSTFNGWNAEAIITGGMWVIGSKGIIALANASQQTPLGICKTTTASGAACEVLVRGPVYVVSEGTLKDGESVSMGAGGALNCVVATGAGSAARATVLTTGSSGAAALVYLL